MMLRIPLTLTVEGYSVPGGRIECIQQLCIVHLVRASLNYVSWSERKQ
jgi:hypothetical protein